MEHKNLLPQDYNKYSFGKFITKRRQELGMSLRQLAIEVNLSAAYISDIENGARKAPKNHITEIIKALNIQSCELDDFYAMAHATHGYCYEFEEYLTSHPKARTALRLAKSENMSDEKWEKLINQMLEDDH